MKTKFIFIFLFTFCVSFAQQSNGPSYAFNIDNFPSMYGGKPEWQRFLHDHLVYPKEELKKNIEGTVKIDFVVREDGKGINPRLKKSISPAIDKEALRLFNMIEWFPAYKDGKAVNVNHTIDINFSVAKYKKLIKERGFDGKAFNDLPADTSLFVYDGIDKDAEYTNPEKTFTEFIASNLEYPEEAKRKGLEGNVAMTFIIETDGRLSNIRIQKGLSGGCNEEAIRVMGLTTWKPAVKNNMYVRYRSNYTFTFSLKLNVQDGNPGSQRMGGQ